MIARAIAMALISSLVVLTSTTAQSVSRALTHIFQEGSALTTVSIVELSSSIQGVAISGGRKKSFTITQAEFDKIWSLFRSSGVQKYGVDESSSKKFEVLNSYIFDSTDQVGVKKTYVVAKKNASDAIASLAAQLRAYAK